MLAVRQRHEAAPRKVFIYNKILWNFKDTLKVFADCKKVFEVKFSLFLLFFFLQKYVYSESS